MRTVPIPVGDEETTSCGLNPLPLLVCSTNHGSSQAGTSNASPLARSTQDAPRASSRCAAAAVSGMATSWCAVRATTDSGTVGHPQPQQADWAEGQHDDQHGKHDGVGPLRAYQLGAEGGDDADEEAPQAGA